MFDDRVIRVLVLPCSSSTGQEIFHSLCFRRDVELYGLDSKENSPGKILYGKKFYSGACASILIDEDRKQLLEYVKYFVAIHEIKHIFPGTDDFVNFLKENENEIGARVITSTLETCIIARRKSLTYQILGKTTRVPKVFNLGEVNQDGFPLFLAPDKCGDKDEIRCRKVGTMEELVSLYDLEKDIICEYLPGKDYSVDCLTGPEGDLLYHCVREGTITRDGVSTITSAATDFGLLEEVQDMAHEINESIEFTGAWFFRVKCVSADGSLCLMEIAPRFTEAMCFSRMSGVNLPLLSLHMSIGKPVRVGEYTNPENAVKFYKTLMVPPLKFDNLYTELDDALVIKGTVNHEAMACLYKYSSIGVPIHLITRRSTNLSKYLKRFHIPESIFTSISQIHDMSKKSLYVAHDSVFIDGSFLERRECYSEEKNIRCFGADAFSFL